MTQTKVMLLGLILILSFSQLSLASGHGDVSVRINGGCQAYIGDTNTLEIWITNDAPEVGMCLGLEFTSSVSYTWVTPYGNSPCVYYEDGDSFSFSTSVIQPEGDAQGTVFSDYRHCPLIVMNSINNESPDSLLFGGVDLHDPPPDRRLPTHQRSTLCYTLKFFIPPGEPETPGGFCVDNIFFPPAGAWRFWEGTYDSNITVIPTFQGNPNESADNPTAPPVCFDVVYRQGGNLDFTNTPTRGNPPLTVFFSGHSATPASSWSWDFGDGGSGSGQNPVHVYEAPGFYRVLMAAVIGNDTLDLCRFAVQVDTVVAKFGATPRVGVIPLEVSFTDLSTGGPTSWLWDFGDGTTSTEQNPTHAYQTAGYFTVTLEAGNSNSFNITRRMNYIRTGLSSIPEIRGDVYGHPLPRPGFNKTYEVTVTNVGFRTSYDDTLILVLPPETIYQGSNPPGSAEGNSIHWHIDSLLAGAYGMDTLSEKHFTVVVAIPTTVLTGTILSARVEYIQDAGFSRILDRDDETVVNSIDPNEIQVQPAGCGAQQGVDSKTRQKYTIYFENLETATAEAIYVMIVDTLDGDLDWGTLQLGPTSADSVLTFSFDSYTGEMIWFFDSLMLPPNVDPPAGEGYVSYSVLPKTGLLAGTTLASRSHVRFDYNDWLSAPEGGPLTLMIDYSDSDSDGVITPCDNCPNVYNPDQLDTDGDGSGDACPWICGDANADAAVDISDVVYLIAYIFAGGSAPNPLLAGDANCDSAVDISDVVYLIAYIFSGGLAPCANC